MSAPAAPLAGKVALVTGATNGIGLWTAIGLQRAGARVIITGRSASRLANASRQIAARSGQPEPETALADFASLAAVRDLAGAVARRAPKLDILVNNAGFLTWRRGLSADGYELTFAVNHLAPFLLTNLLLPQLRTAAPARIVTLSSSAHRRGRIDFDDLMATRRYSAMAAYAQSKLANILFTVELARRLAGSGVVANSLHPGLVATGFGDWPGLPGIFWRTIQPFMLTPEQGASTTLHVATDPALANVTGRFFAKSRQEKPAPAARDTAVAARLWRESEHLIAAARLGVTI